MRFKTTWILFVVAAIAVAFFFLIEQPRHRREIADSSRRDMLTRILAEDFGSIRLERPGSILQFEKRAGEWWMSLPVSEKADPASVNVLVRTVASLEIDQRYPAEDLATYGLESPPVVLTMSTMAGESLGVDVGDFNMNKSQCYAREHRGGDVLLVHAGLRRYAFREESFFRNKKVYDFISDDVVSARIAGGGPSFVWSRTGGGKWRVSVGGDTFPGNPEAVNNLLSELRAMRVERNVSDDPADFARYFGSPAGSIRLTLAGKPQEATLVFAESSGGDECLVAVRDDPRIVAVDASVLEIFRRTLYDFRDRKVLHFDRGDVSRIRVEGPEGPTTIIRQEDTWTFNNPGMGAISDAEVSSLFVALMDLKYKEIIEEDLPDPRPHGLDSPNFRLSLYAGDELLDRFEIGDKLLPRGEEYITGLSSPYVGKVDSETLDAIKRIFANFTAR